MLSGVLMGTSYIPFPPWAVFFCYVPLWLFCLKQNRLKPILVGAWWCQFVACLIGFNWVAYTIHEFGFFPWYLAVPGLLLFAGVANLHIPIALLLWFFVRSKQKQSGVALFLTLFSLPLFFTLVMEYYPMIFEWNFGYTWFYGKWLAAQTAEIWGFQFLHTLTVFFNLFFLYWFLHKKQVGWLVLAGVLFAGLTVYGFYLKNRWPEPDKSTQALLVQANIENLSKTYHRTKKDPRASAFSQLVKETERYLLAIGKVPVEEKSYKSARVADPADPTDKIPIEEKGNSARDAVPKSARVADPADPTGKVPVEEKSGSERDAVPPFVVWPEGAYPYFIRYSGKRVSVKDPAKGWAKKWGIPLVVSATGEGDVGMTNSIFVFDEGGGLVASPYHKIFLLAFGEYLPFEDWLPLKKILPYYGRSFTRGTGESKVTLLKGVSLGFQICYEGLFDFFTRDLAKEGAQVLVNVTNDSWYGSWQEPFQHLYMTLSRAVEVRRPMLRVTNTGLSALVSAKGERVFVSSLNESWVRLVEIPYYREGRQTLFTRWGYYINRIVLWLLFFLFACCFVWRWWFFQRK